MKDAQNLFTLSSRITAHKKMACAALFADSSARIRLKRYRHHMHRARSLELLADLVRALRVGGAK
ncbi:MAG: hypothetical protein I8H73_07135 [Pseudomonadales bacterium]|nr:hypothetical protein [Pseudomonadales bacterium]